MLLLTDDCGARLGAAYEDLHEGSFQFGEDLTAECHRNQKLVVQQAASQAATGQVRPGSHRQADKTR